MELFFTTLSLCIFLSFVFLSIRLLFNNSKPLASSAALPPPGKTGWPVIGESLEYLSAGWKGHPEKFVFDRMSKYASPIFRTNLFGEDFVVLCGAEGNKFLFTNEKKLVQSWWPKSLDRVFPNLNSSEDHVNKTRKVLASFLKADALSRYIPAMDDVARRHFSGEWDDKEQVTVFPLVKNYTFSIACHLFMSMQNPDEIRKFRLKFDGLISGLFSVPIALPGTQFWKAIRTAECLRKEFVSIIRQRKIELADDDVALPPMQDILTRMVLSRDESGNSMDELDIADTIMGLLIGGHDSSSSACAFIVKYLAELSYVYDAVYKEQMDIAKSKRDGELLNWEDLQKMKYSWNVAREVIRLTPPSRGTFREAIADFTYKGFFIPKGWKLYWSAFSTHKNPKFFPEPEKFDPSNFEGSGPPPYTFVPFGGGPRICPGKELARLEILVFIHHLVKRFKLEKIVIPNEKVVWNPTPIPAKGLPIKLYPCIIN